MTADHVAQEEPFATELEGFTWDWPVRDAAWYTELLHRLGFHDLNVRVQVYPHLLASLDEVVEWERATYLLPYTSRMGTETAARYIERYRAQLRAEVTDQRPYLYAYKRLLVHAWKRPQPE